MGVENGRLERLFLAPEERGMRRAVRARCCI